jgi:hypothetical protein
MTTPVYTCPQCLSSDLIHTGAGMRCVECHGPAVPMPQLVTDLDVIELERMYKL